MSIYWYLNTVLQEDRQQQDVTEPSRGFWWVTPSAEHQQSKEKLRVGPSTEPNLQCCITETWLHLGPG